LIVFLGVSRLMAQDITKVIDSLRDAAVTRCRERIEKAALKAKDLLKDGQPVETQKKPGNINYGVTSLLRRKHGL